MLLASIITRCTPFFDQTQNTPHSHSACQDSLTIPNETNLQMKRLYTLARLRAGSLTKLLTTQKDLLLDPHRVFGVLASHEILHRCSPHSGFGSRKEISTVGCSAAAIAHNEVVSVHKTFQTSLGDDRTVRE